MDNPIAFSPVLAKAFGVCGALLIQQIHYWCDENSNIHEGYSWVWNTTRQWADNLMAFDERTIRYTLKKLREDGVVVVGSFNKHKYDKTLWYRLDYEALLVKLREKFPHRNLCPEPYGKIFRIIEDKMPAPIPKTTSKTTTETTEATAAPSQGEIPTTDTLDLGEQDMAKGPSMASELLAHLKEKNGTKLPGKENTAASLESTFKQVAPKHNEMACIPSFTMKDKGQLGRLSKKWGGVADRVMETICSDWIAFAKEVTTQLGISKYPLIPHLPFIVKYADNALAFHHVASAQVIANPPTPTVSGGVKATQEGPNKKLVILKKKTPTQLPVESKKPTTSLLGAPKYEGDEEMTLEALLAFKPKASS